MLGLILSSVIKESTFLKVLRSVIGLKLFGGPLGLPGFGMAIRTPELMSSSSWFVNVLFNTFAIVWSRRGVFYFRVFKFLSVKGLDCRKHDIIGLCAADCFCLFVKFFSNAMLNWLDLMFNNRENQA